MAYAMAGPWEGPPHVKKWTSYMSEEGYPYYYDHATQRSLWASPSDWQAGFDSMSGRAFWRNTITDEVSWDQTALSSTTPASAPQIASMRGQWVQNDVPVERQKNAMYAQEADGWSPLAAEAASLRSRSYLEGGAPSVRPASKAGKANGARSYSEPSAAPAAFGVVPHSEGKRDRRDRAERAILAARTRAAYPHGGIVDGTGPARDRYDRQGYSHGPVGRAAPASDHSSDDDLANPRLPAKKLYDLTPPPSDDDNALHRPVSRTHRSRSRARDARYADEKEERSDASSDGLAELIRSGFSLGRGSSSGLGGRKPRRKSRSSGQHMPQAASAKAPVIGQGSKAGRGAMARHGAPFADPRAFRHPDPRDADIDIESDAGCAAYVRAHPDAHADAESFADMSVDERVSWLRGALSGVGSSLAANAQLIVLFLASRSLPFLTAVIAATRVKTTGAVQYLESISSAAATQLSPRGTLPAHLRVSCTGRAGGEDSDGGYATALSAAVTPSGAGLAAGQPDMGGAVARAAEMLHSTLDTLGAGLHHVHAVLQEQRPVGPFQLPPPERDALPEGAALDGPPAPASVPAPTLSDLLFSPAAVTAMLRSTPGGGYGYGMDKDELAELKGQDKDGEGGGAGWAGMPHGHEYLPYGPGHAVQEYQQEYHHEQGNAGWQVLVPAQSFAWQEEERGDVRPPLPVRAAWGDMAQAVEVGAGLSGEGHGEGHTPGLSSPASFASVSLGSPGSLTLRPATATVAAAWQERVQSPNRHGSSRSIRFADETPRLSQHLECLDVKRGTQDGGGGGMECDVYAGRQGLTAVV